MMKLIHKQLVNYGDTGTVRIDMPTGAQILSIQGQPAPYSEIGRVELMIWYLFDADQLELWTEERTFFVAWTGKKFEIDEKTWRYLATAQVGSLVCHVFEILESINLYGSVGGDLNDCKEQPR